MMVDPAYILFFIPFLLIVIYVLIVGLSRHYMKKKMVSPLAIDVLKYILSNEEDVVKNKSFMYGYGEIKVKGKDGISSFYKRYPTDAWDVKGELAWMNEYEAELIGGHLLEIMRVRDREEKDMQIRHQEEIKRVKRSISKKLYSEI